MMFCKLADKAHFRYPQGLCVSSLWCTQAPKVSLNKALHTKNSAPDFTILSAMDTSG